MHMMIVASIIYTTHISPINFTKQLSPWHQAYNNHQSMHSYEKPSHITPYCLKYRFATNNKILIKKQDIKQ